MRQQQLYCRGGLCLGVPRIVTMICSAKFRCSRVSYQPWNCGHTWSKDRLIRPSDIQMKAGGRSERAGAASIVSFLRSETRRHARQTNWRRAVERGCSLMSCLRVDSSQRSWQWWRQGWGCPSCRKWRLRSEVGVDLFRWRMNARIGGGRRAIETAFPQSRASGVSGAFGAKEAWPSAFC